MPLDSRIHFAECFKGELTGVMLELDQMLRIPCFAFGDEELRKAATWQLRLAGKA